MSANELTSEFVRRPLTAVETSTSFMPDLAASSKKFLSAWESLPLLFPAWRWAVASLRVGVVACVLDCAVCANSEVENVTIAKSVAAGREVVVFIRPIVSFPRRQVPAGVRASSRDGGGADPGMKRLAPKAAGGLTITVSMTARP